MAETKAKDWEAIEREYRAGQLSIAQIAREYEVSRPAIDKRAKRFEWTRNLSDAVRKEVQSRLVADAVAGRVAPCNARDTIEAAASRGVGVVLAHRTTLQRLNRISSGLLTALEAVVDGDTTHPAIALIGAKETVADVLEKVQRTMAKVIPLERQAFNLNDAPEEAQAVHEIVRRVVDATGE